MDEFVVVLKQAIIEVYLTITVPIESLIESMTAMMNDYNEPIGDIDYFDSDKADNKASLLFIFLSLHKKSKVLLQKNKRIYKRQKIP